MNKNDFLRQLEESLLRLSKSDRDDILLDYEDHFRVGEEKGMTEEEVAESLGNPAAIAEQYLENLPADAKGAPAKVEEEETAVIALYGTVDEEYSAPEADTVPGQVNNSEQTKSEQSAGHVSGGRRFANVVFWIAAVLTIIVLIYCWAAMLCAVIGLFAAAAVLVGCSFIFITNYILLFVGFLLLGAGCACLAVLFITALKYAMRGLKKLIGVFKNTSNKIMGRA